MSQFRNLTDHTLLVGYGLTYAVKVAPDTLITVNDGADAAYECQPTVWQLVGPSEADVADDTSSIDTTPSTTEPAADAPAAS